jgi:CheY-like chemotaxis protein
MRNSFLRFTFHVLYRQPLKIIAHGLERGKGRIRDHHACVNAYGSLPAANCRQLIAIDFAPPPVVNLPGNGILPERLEASMTDDPRCVVYIEDEQEMIDLVRLILSRKGFEVIGANGGREGLDEIRKTLPDLVLLDLMMPDMDGWEVYQQMKAEEATRQIPVIIITAKAQNIDKVLGLHIAKVDDYISKPFSPKELVDSVERVLAGHKVENGS